MNDHLADITKSSIFNIILTHSVANVSALYVINAGYTTFSSCISLNIPYFLREIPLYFSPFICLFLNSVTTYIVFNPEFSANVSGITSNASAYALTTIYYAPTSVLLYSYNF